MRAFFCIEVDEATQKELERIISRLRHQVTTRVSWVRRENLHVTLKFLGEIDPVSLPQLQHAAAEAMRSIAPFDWQLNRLGAFPQMERPRVIWVGCREEPQPLHALYVVLETLLQALGHPPERGAFTAHVTLGRVKEGGPRATEIARALENIPSFAYPLRTETLTLMESQLTPTGAIYRPRFQLPFDQPNR
jgi:2'-5' RNA ligase